MISLSLMLPVVFAVAVFWAGYLWGRHDAVSGGKIRLTNLPRWKSPVVLGQRELERVARAEEEEEEEIL